MIFRKLSTKRKKFLMCKHDAQFNLCIHTPYTYIPNVLFMKQIIKSIKTKGHSTSVSQKVEGVFTAQNYVPELDV